MRVIIFTLIFLSNSITPAGNAEEPEGVTLSKRKWTTLVLFRGKSGPTQEIPEDAPVRNFPEGYSFAGPGTDRNHLGEFKIDGRYLAKEGYLRREFGEHALLRLPKADAFDLEGIVHLEKEGGWLMLLGWNLETKSGHVLYNSQLRTSGSHWFIVRVKEGIAVPDSQQKIVQREINGEGPLKLRIEEKKLTFSVGGALLCKEYELPFYEAGHIALGTFPTQYGPQDISIKSLRMRLR